MLPLDNVFVVIMLQPLPYDCIDSCSYFYIICDSLVTAGVGCALFEFDVLYLSSTTEWMIR